MAIKIVLISDTHCQLDNVEIPEGDLLIHSGDLTYRGNVQEMTKELNLLGKRGKDFKKIIYICGNHDWLGERNPTLTKEICEAEGITYLDHTSATFEGMNIFGSAYTPEFFSWAFNVQRGKALANKWAQIPDNTDILVTHGPPMGILDPVQRFNHRTGEQEIEHVGCMDLYNRIQELEQLKLHVFGHLHDGYGQIKIRNTTFINASICTEQYKPTNKPVVIEI
jgi:Icc-related predicted phosphoesterase